jgi:hypothetical protein
MAGRKPAKTKKKMFGPGTLLRIKRLENFAVFTDGEIAYEAIILNRFDYSERESVLNKHTNFKSFFQSLPLELNPQESYVAEVVNAIYSPGYKVPIWVGVKFYTSVTESGKPKDIWSESVGKVYYYAFSNALLLAKILSFENLGVGDLIEYGEQKTGIVIAKNKSRRKSIAQNGLTRHIVHFVCGNFLIKDYLYSNNKFKLIARGT